MHIYIYICISFVCHVQMTRYMYKKNPTHLFIQKLKVGKKRNITFG